MKNAEHDWFQKELEGRWEKLAQCKYDVTDAKSIQAEIADKYGYEREKAEYEYEQFMNDLVGRDERAARMQEGMGNEQNRGPLSQRI